jgi:hypothetical protein
VVSKFKITVIVFDIGIQYIGTLSVLEF